MAMITDFVPGATVVHDQLHVRGGHQVSWAIDGVPVPNTNIASNVGPQFNPKDIDYVEEQRGSFSAEYGDRSYGVFNVATRTGFERSRQGELVTSYGNFNGVELELERRFHKGLGFQIFWNHGNNILINRDTDDTQSIDAMPSINTFLPGTVPTDFDKRNRFLNYKRDSNTPKHQIRWNFIAELPVGRGKKLLGNSKGIVEKLVGGWQVAAIGNDVQGWWSLPTSYYPTANPIEYYGFKYPIQDCTSGSCFDIRLC